MDDEKQRRPLEPPPDQTDPTLRFARYIVEPETLAYAGADHLDADQLEAAQATGWLVWTKDELLREWRNRSA
jgi:hypothetical protein